MCLNESNGNINKQMDEDSDLGQCEVHLLLSKAFPGTNAAPAAERYDQEWTGTGHFPIL